MSLCIRRTDWVALAVVLALGTAFTVYGIRDNQSIRQSLNDIAQQKLDEWFQHIDRSKYESIAIIEPSKAFLIFGRAWGTVHLFIRERGDEEMKTFKGLEYYCKRCNGKWEIQDSAGCGALEHHVKAFKEMEAQGMKVSPKVYEKLNKS